MVASGLVARRTVCLGFRSPSASIHYPRHMFTPIDVDDVGEAMCRGQRENTKGSG